MSGNPTTSWTLDSTSWIPDSRYWIPIFASETWILGPVVRRPISANPGLNLNAGVFFFSSKAFSRRIFSSLSRLANHQIAADKRIKLNLRFKLSYLNSNFVLPLGYLNPASNNSALNSNRQWDYRFLELYSGFQRSRFQIPQAKFSRISDSTSNNLPASGIPYNGAKAKNDSENRYTTKTRKSHRDVHTN